MDPRHTTELADHAVAASPSLWRERLVAFYSVHNPSKLDSVDKVLEAYRGRVRHPPQRAGVRIPLRALCGGGVSEAALAEPAD